MFRLIMLTLPIVSVLLRGGLFVGEAVAQQKTLKEQLVGSWLLISNTNSRPDGTRVDTFGPAPKGVAFFDINDHFSLVLVRSDLPKFASNNRVAGTADENKAVVQGSIAYFGTYTINEADKIATVQIEGSTFPNWVGATQKRLVEISGDELTLINTPASAGGSVEVKWRRLR